MARDSSSSSSEQKSGSQSDDEADSPACPRRLPVSKRKKCCRQLAGNHGKPMRCRKRGSMYLMGKDSQLNEEKESYQGSKCRGNSSKTLQNEIDAKNRWYRGGEQKQQFCTGQSCHEKYGKYRKLKETIFRRVLIKLHLLENQACSHHGENEWWAEPSSASEGNFFEAVNMSLDHYSVHHVDRSLAQTG